MQENLEKRYGFSVAFSMVVGIVIGTGIFFKAGQILKATNLNPTIAIMAWVVGGIISILSGLTAAEVGAAIPETGGMIAWIRRIYGEKAAFLVGWAQMVIYCPAMCGLIAYYFATFTADFLGINLELNPYFRPLTAIGVVTFLYLVNIFTKSLGGKIQTVATATKLLPLLLITIFGFLFGANPAEQVFSTPEVISQTVTQASPILFLGMALVPVMFAFDGWIYVGTIAGDLKNVRKDLPKAIILGLGFISILYLALNIALLKVFPADKLVEVGMIGVATELFGKIGAKFIFLGIMISSFGGLNGMVLVSTRTPYALALEGHLPKENFFLKIDSKFKQPINSSIVMYIMTLACLIAMIVTKNPDVFGDIPVALFWLIYSLVFLGVFILRKREPNLERPYRVPLYPIIPLLALIGALSIFLYATLSNTRYMTISLALTAIGILVYRDKK